MCVCATGFAWYHNFTFLLVLGTKEWFKRAALVLIVCRKDDVVLFCYIVYHDLECGRRRGRKKRRGTTTSECKYSVIYLLQKFGWEVHGFTRNHEIVLAGLCSVRYSFCRHVTFPEFLLLFVVLLCASLVLQFYVGKVWKFHYLPESGATVLLGMLIGSR